MDVNAFLNSLPYMLKGMIGIFIVTAAMILSIVVLNKLTSLSKKDKE